MRQLLSKGVNAIRKIELMGTSTVELTLYFFAYSCICEFNFLTSALQVFQEFPIKH